MRKLLTILLCLTLTSANAANWYVNFVTGDNSNTGSIGSPWKDLVKVNISFASMSSGDSVLLFSGQTFPGAILVNKAGIHFGIYGGTAKATISGLTTITGWSLVTTGIWKAPLTAPNDLRYLTINGVNKQWATTPNVGQGINSYLYINGFSNGTPKTITYNALPPTPDRTGNRFALKGETWFLSIFKCTSVVAQTIFYDDGVIPLVNPNPFVRYPQSRSGFMWVGNRADLDQSGEWFYDSTAHEVYVYSGATDPNTWTVKASVLNRGIDMQGLGGISIENIRLEGFNQAGVYARNGSGTLKVKNCTIDGSGGYGVLFSNTPNIIVEDDTLKNIYSIGLRLPTNAINGASIQRNFLDSASNTPFETMFYWGADIDGNGIVCGMNNQNTIDNTVGVAAYTGIWFTGSNVVIKNNEVKHWSKWSNDCGGTYTHAYTGREDSTRPYTRYSNRTVINNYLHDATAYPYGFSSLSTPACKGLYNDDQSMNVTYTNNLVAFVDIGMANNVDSNIQLHNTTIIATQGMNLFKKYYNNLSLLNFTRNVISNVNANSVAYNYINDGFGNTQTIAQAMAPMGILDSNYVNGGNAGYRTETYASPGVGARVTTYNFTGWQTTTGKSANDVSVPYLPFSNTGRKLVVNWTKTPVTVSLPGVFRDYYGKTYVSSIQLDSNDFRLLYYVSSATINITIDSNPVITLPTTTSHISGSATFSGGTITGYQWRVKSAPTTPTITSPTSNSTNITGLSVAGTYVFTLIATNNIGGTDSAFATITVNPASVTVPPVANISPASANITLPVNSVLLDGSGSTCTQCPIATYTWAQLPGAPNTATGLTNTAITTPGGMIAGTYLFRLTVTDNVGATGSRTVQVTVNPAPPPTPAPVRIRAKRG